MKRFIEIRGGTGVGKSTLVRAVMECATVDRISTDRDIWVGVVDKVRVAVPGSYRMATGGLENRYSVVQCVQLLEEGIKHASVVLFEGGMISKTTGKVYEWLRNNAKVYDVVYLSLPLPKVRTNMEIRRNRKLRPTEMGVIERDHECVRRAVNRIAEDGVPVHTCTIYEKALETIFKLIREST